MFFFTPFLVSHLGKEQYGIWSLVFSIVAYMGLADAGMRQSIVRHVSKYYAKKDWLQINQVLSSSVIIYSIVFAVILVAISIISLFLLDKFTVPDSLFRVTQITLIIIGVNQGLSFFLIPFSSMGPFHRFDISSYVSIPTLLLQTGSMVYLLLNGYGLVSMALVVFAVNLIDKTVMIIIRRKLFPEVKFSRKSIHKENTKELLNYGFYSFLIIVATIAIFYTDNIIIGIFISMSGVAVYTIPATIIMQLRHAINAISIVLVPAISHFDAEQNMTKIREIYFKSTRYLYFLTTYLAVCLLVFGGPFILLWVKDAFAESVNVLNILTVSACIFFPQMIAHSILFGISKHKITFYIMSFEAVANVILSLLLVKDYGILGVAVGTAIPQIIIYSIIYPVVFLKTIDADISRFYRESGKSILYGILIFVPSAWLMKTVLVPDNWFNLIFDCMVVTFLMGTGLLFLVFDKEDKDRILKKLRLKK